MGLKEEYSKQQYRTIKIFQDAFIKLLNEKKIESITVVDLCNETDFNRSTFYRYFIDIIDFRDKMIQLLFDEIFEILKELPSDKIKKELSPRLAFQRIKKALTATKKNRELYKKVICDHYYDIIEKTMEENLTLFKETIETSHCSRNQKEIFNSYICGGVSQIWIHWIETDCAADIDEVSKSLYVIITNFYQMLENLT